MDSELLCLEAGSGATTPVQRRIDSALRVIHATSLSVVGGRNEMTRTARKAVQAGADWIITGNLTESFDDADVNFQKSFDRIYLRNEFLKFTLLHPTTPSRLLVYFHSISCSLAHSSSEIFPSPSKSKSMAFPNNFPPLFFPLDCSVKSRQ